jgi:hypothetical protein
MYAEYSSGCHEHIWMPHQSAVTYAGSSFETAVQQLNYQDLFCCC